MQFETLSVSLEDHIATVRLNRPEKANAMNAAMWQDIRSAFQWVDETPEARVAVLQGEGKLFTAGIDLVTCADMRYCSADAYFTIKEIDVGMAADVGTLQRLPRLVGEGIARELAYTGRNFAAEEARQIGLVNRVFDSREALYAGVREIAATIAAKSPLSIRGTKEMITYARDHSVADSLNYIATWNAAMLMSQDLTEAMMSNMAKRAPSFKD